MIFDFVPQQLNTAQVRALGRQKVKSQPFSSNKSHYGFSFLAV
ncbi:hypothetical protein [Methylomonas fluvii]|nr:hypothetical protein [Methylomonas fluvii]